MKMNIIWFLIYYAALCITNGVAKKYFGIDTQEQILTGVNFICAWLIASNLKIGEDGK